MVAKKWQESASRSRNVREEERGHLTVNYTGNQTIINTISHWLSTKLIGIDRDDWFVPVGGKLQIIVHCRILSDPLIRFYLYILHIPLYKVVSVFVCSEGSR